MRSTSGYASIWCIFFHQLQPRDSMAPITRVCRMGQTMIMSRIVLSGDNVITLQAFYVNIFLSDACEQCFGIRRSVDIYVYLATHHVIMVQ